MTYTKLSIQINSKDTTPDFMGSQLRGALGYALKEVSCINPSFSCEGCFASASCVYYAFYEEANSIHSYRFDFLLGNGAYSFDFYLFEEACEHLPYVLLALDKMLRERGLGKTQRTYQDFVFLINGIVANPDKTFFIPQNPTRDFKTEHFYPNIKLSFVTPLRMKKNNRLIRDANIELKDILSSIYQRALELKKQKRKKLDFEIQGEIIAKDIYYKELTRMSNRQKSRMNLGGIMGSIELKGLNKESYELLSLGVLIGVGKSCVFGLGKIEIEERK